MTRAIAYACGLAAAFTAGLALGYVNGWDDHTRETESQGRTA
jgi:hypothetical protein